MTEMQEDPTANVLKLVAEAVKRLDDLRDMQIGYEKDIRTLEAKWIESKDYAQSLQNKAMENRIAEVERMQYEDKGKSNITDPIMDTLLIEVKKLSRSMVGTEREAKGRTDLIGWLFGGVAIAIALATYFFGK